MQKITTPKGETLVLMPIEEYEALVDRGDIALAERVKSDIVSGREELVPAHVVSRLVAGESPLRVWREHRGLSVAELARRSDVREADLSGIETGGNEGSVVALKRIAAALSVDLDDLV